MDLNGEWIIKGEENNLRAIFQQGRFLLLVGYDRDKPESDMTSMAVGFVDETEVHVPSWGWKGVIEDNDRRIDWGGFGIWRKR